MLQSPFTSIRAVVDKLVGFSWFMADRWTSYEHIKHVDCPVLFIHGYATYARADTQIYAPMGALMLYVPVGAQHSSCYVYPKARSYHALCTYKRAYACSQTHAQMQRRYKKGILTNMLFIYTHAIVTNSFSCVCIV